MPLIVQDEPENGRTLTGCGGFHLNESHGLTARFDLWGLDFLMDDIERDLSGALNPCGLKIRELEVTLDDKARRTVR